MEQRRSSGILAHISSLPSPFGIGDIGPSSYEFLSFLKSSEQSYWQILPTGPTDPIFDNSPYMGSSAFAGNSLLISPQLLLEDDLLSASDLQNPPLFSPYLVEFRRISNYKKALLQTAFSKFSFSGNEQIIAFQKNSEWLLDYALFMTAKQIFGGTSWNNWPTDIRDRDEKALQQFETKYHTHIEYYKFEQYQFFKQWQLLKRSAEKNSIKLFGDLPIYVGYDSADVWANQDIFVLDQDSKLPSYVAGVPPDYFSEEGQRWGNPLYDWQTKSIAVREKINNWWVKRLRNLFTHVDIARIDHFRAFESYWAIPQEEETGINGVWLKGPGENFFQVMKSNLGQMNLIAEDLGIITDKVTKLREKIKMPGMKVLQFAFDGDRENTFIPYNFQSSDCVVYTGTHDNDTTLGWYLGNKIDDTTRRLVKNLANGDSDDTNSIHRDMIYLAQSSIAKLCIFPLQDVLGFGNDCKMNSPGIASGNWRWRCAPEFLSKDIENYLSSTTKIFNRARN